MSRGGEEPILKALWRDTTAYLCFTLFVVALGPLQFGYHLVIGSSLISHEWKLTDEL